MNTNTFAFCAVLATAALAGLRAQTPAAVEPLHFHHVHLNSVDPAAAAAYYPKPFAQSAAKTTFNGFEAVKTGNVYILFTKVNTPPTNELTGPQTSVWHFGWNTPNSREYNANFRKMGLTIAQMWNGSDTDANRVDFGAHTLRVTIRGFGCELRSTTRRLSNTAVFAERDLEHHKRPALAHQREERLIERCRSRLPEADLDGDAALAEK